jgi:hypothetical protein
MQQLSSKSTAILLIIITLLSFWLRVWGIQFGLPFAYHPDEQQYILPAIGVVSGNFKPLAHYNPALYPYLVGLIYTVTYAGLKLFNAFPPHFDLNIAWSESMQPWITGLIYLARYTSVAAGVFTTLMVYCLGRRAYSRATGVGAAIIFGLTFLPAREAHFAVSDAPVALGVAVTLYFCLKIVERGCWIDYFWTGLALGLSAATKYSAGLLVLPLGAAHLLSRRYTNWLERLTGLRLMIMDGLVAIVGYLVTSPYTLLERDEFWADFSENLTSAKIGFQGLELDPAGGAIFYLKGLIWGLGWPLFILFLVAVIFGLWRRQRVDIVLLTLPLLGFIYMQRQEMYFVRWLTPFLPPMAVLAAETVQQIGILASRRISAGQDRGSENVKPLPSVRSLGVVYWSLLITLLLTLPSTYVAVQADYLFRQADTRTEALDWVRQNIPPGSNLAAEVLSPPWGPPLIMPGLNIGPYNFAPVPNGGVAEVDLQQYQQWGSDYVIASSFYYARPLRDKTHQAQLTTRMEILQENAELVAVFQPYQPDYDGFFYHDQVYGPADDTLYRRQPGPIIKIYRLP